MCLYLNPIFAYVSMQKENHPKPISNNDTKGGEL